MHILNQMTASHELNELKDLLQKLYPDSRFEYIDNPREEKSTNSLKVVNQKFRDMGHQGIYVNEDHLKELVETCKQYPERWKINLPYIHPVSFWQKLQGE